MNTFLSYQLNSNGDINQTNYRSFIARWADPFDHQKVLVDEIATKCVKNIYNLVKEVENHSEKQYDDDCSMLGLAAVECARGELFKSCPADIRETQNGCKKFRELIKSKKW